MTMTNETRTKIDRLLHDAERAHTGAGFAAQMMDQPAALRLIGKRDTFIAAAKELDPQRSAPGWAQVDIPAFVLNQ